MARASPTPHQFTIPAHRGPQAWQGPPSPPYANLALGCPTPRLESLEVKQRCPPGCPALHTLSHHLTPLPYPDSSHTGSPGWVPQPSQ